MDGEEDALFPEDAEGEEEGEEEEDG